MSNKRTFFDATKFLLLASLLSIGLASCCEPEGVWDNPCSIVELQYRYVRTNKDEYQRFIQKERHFLFDKEGVFIKEFPANEMDRQHLRVSDLETGEYAMLTIGNLTPEYTFLGEMKEGKTKLRDITLALDKKTESGKAFLQAEELFWNLRHFQVKKPGVFRYICDMANIHCHLYMKITWETHPPKGDPQFIVELQKLIPSYQLDWNQDYTLQIAGTPSEGESKDLPTKTYAVHHFPFSNLPAESLVQQKSELRGEELFCEIRSLRYLNEQIPSLQIFHEGKQLFNTPVDLGPIFHKWGWLPNLNPEQIYAIELKIRKDGKVDVSPWGTAHVIDWENGGTFGA